ncbi:CNNM domain-containing protein [Jonesia quinghaiensis]|uniref:CNNM domain-containing protein n=1 Tax=Jonesia quinghaiensis TaxID=262806 RepID=UPI00040DE8A0|nr:hemolysin family protein [Jonesia quinghaiensis]
MNNPWIVAAVTAVLIIASAFFVIIEFALLGARRHRLEEEAGESRSARAALRSMNELTIMLAGAQLGITVCTFALGAVTKPAVDKWLGPIFTDWGMPSATASVLSFALSLFFVTFLHLVVGEMAPKSWAIAHPERASKAIAVPARGFIAIFRPLLMWINHMANRLVAASGVEPVDRAAAGGYDVATMRHLVEHSAEMGSLEESVRSPLAGAIDLETMRVDALVRRDTRPTSVTVDATVADVQAASQRTGHLRILVNAEPGEELRVLHVRDTLLEAAESPARPLARPALVLPAGTLLHEALTSMRRASEQLAVVRDGDTVIGVITLSDVMKNVLPTASV